MNVERVQEVLLEVQGDLESTKIMERLRRLETALENMVNSPGAPDPQTQVAAALAETYEALRDAPSTKYGPVWKHSVEELTLDAYLASELEAELRGIIQENQMTPAVAQQRVAKMRTEIGSGLEQIRNILAGFKFIEVAPREIPPGKAEVGILIPRNAVGNNLREFGEEAQSLNQDLNTIAEAVSGEVEDLQIQELSTSDILVYVIVGVYLAKPFAQALSTLIDCYKKILDIRDHRNHLLKVSGVPEQTLNPIEKFVSSMMKEAIDKETAELLKLSKADPGRKNELKKLLDRSLWHFAQRLDKGYNFDVRPPETDGGEEDDADREATDLLTELRSKLDFINVSGERILELPKGVDEELPDDSPKPGKPATKNEPKPKGSG